MKPTLFFFFLLSCLTVSSQKQQPSNFLSDLLKQHPKEFKSVLDKKKTYEVQILYTQIDRDENNAPHFTTYSFNVDTARYFYPASTVKFPVAVLALEKLNEINNPRVTKHTPIYHDSVYSGQSRVKSDTTSEGGAPSIAHYIKKIFVASDNDAFNRLYEFIGQKEINEKLREKGYHTRIVHRLNRWGTPDENRHTEAVRFMEKDSLVYAQPMLVNDNIIKGPEILAGKGYYNGTRLIRKPFNFSDRNYFSIPDQHAMLKAFLFPETVTPEKRFHLTPDDRKIVLQYMSQLPTETLFPPYYKDTTYVDAYGKLFLYGCESTPIPDHIRIFNKLGVAYGYALDNAYIVDFNAGVEFLLTAVIFTNQNQIFNDDTYEYWTIGFPFMKNLGQVIYEFEKSRTKKYLPDLSGFQFQYELNRTEYK